MLLSKHFTPAKSCEIKMAGDRTFEGYASVWGSVDSYGDTVAQGAFKKTLEERGLPKMYYGHRSDHLPIGKWVNAKEDERGLYVKGELTPGRSFSDEVYAALNHGTVDGLSIGFYDRGSEELKDGGRLLKEIELVEVSIVNEPAEKLAHITSVKSAIAAFETLKDCEMFLRDAGLSRVEAKAFVSRAAALARCDAVAELKDEIRQRDMAAANTQKAIEIINSIYGGLRNE